MQRRDRLATWREEERERAREKVRISVEAARSDWRTRGAHSVSRGVSMEKSCGWIRQIN